MFGRSHASQRSAILLDVVRNSWVCVVICFCPREVAIFRTSASGQRILFFHRSLLIEIAHVLAEVPSSTVNTIKAACNNRSIGKNLLEFTVELNVGWIDHQGLFNAEFRFFPRVDLDEKILRTQEHLLIWLIAKGNGKKIEDLWSRPSAESNLVCLDRSMQHIQSAINIIQIAHPIEFGNSKSILGCWPIE